MKMMKLLSAWIVKLAVSLLTPVVSIYLMYKVFFEIRFYHGVDGNGFILLPYLYVSRFKSYEYGSCMTTIFIVAGAVISFLIPVIAILLWINTTLVMMEHFTIARKNAFCTLCYEYEEIHHIAHKERINGTEWKKRKEKAKQEKAEKKKEAKRKKEERWEKFKRYAYEQKYGYQEQGSYQGQGSSQGQSSYQEQSSSQEQNRSQRNSWNDNSGSAELQRAMAVFMLDDLNFTEEELKKIRNKLIKSFHPDGSDDEGADTRHAQKINGYYAILKKYAKK